MRQARYKSVVDDLALAIHSGRLPAGTRLPTHRELAAREGVALATATRIYAELRDAGLVVGEPGRGTFVRDQTGFGGLEPRRVRIADRVADLSFIQPLHDSQSDSLRQALRKLAGSGDIAALLAQHPTGGRYVDRAVVATYLLDRGIDVPPRNVLLTNGAQHGLDIAVRTLTRPGAVIAVDALTYPGIKLIAGTQAIELAGIPCTPAGPDLDALDALSRRRAVTAIYVMPTIQNPLGFVLDQQDRHRMVDIARRHDCLVIEDATYAFLDPAAGPTLYQLAPERTVYIGSLSKNLAAGLRFGFIVAPDTYLEPAATVLRTSSWSVPSIVTALATSWLADGTVTRLESLRRDDAGQRQEVASNVLAELPYTAHPRSYFGWLVLPPELRNDTAAQRLAKGGILVSTSDAHAVSPHPPNALRLSLATPDTSVMKHALNQIRELLQI